MIKKIWNGMPIKQKKQTIAGRFRSYSIILLLFGILACVVAVTIRNVYSRGYDEMINSTVWLQDLYENLDRMQELEEKYLFLPSRELIGEYQRADEEARENYDRLAGLRIKGNYRRNIEDMELLLETYGQAQRQLMEEFQGDTSTLGMGELQQRNEEIRRVLQTLKNKETVLSEELQVYFRQQRNWLRQRLGWLTGALLFTLVTGFGLIYFRMRRLSREIVLPLGQITDKAVKIQENALEELVAAPEATDTLRWQGEIEVPPEVEALENAFSKMLLQIQNQVEKLKETVKIREQLKEQEMENLRISNLLTNSKLQSLQAQVNPHFLFNVLNMIQQTLYLDRKDKTSFLLQETAAFLRASLDHAGKIVTLQTELEVLGNYINIQEERLGERILFEFQLDERIRDMRVPSFILQPLVENSLIHGVGSYLEDAVVRIETTFLEREQQGCIRVSDNGIGIPEEELQKLRAEMKREDLLPDKRIGVLNVYKRLRIFSEGVAEMTIESREGEGTMVTILIPYTEERRNDGERSGTTSEASDKESCKENRKPDEQEMR